ncbi:MAG: hypothetical protein RLY31_2125 [Bacteroidota bacterium]
MIHLTFTLSALLTAFLIVLIPAVGQQNRWKLLLGASLAFYLVLAGTGTAVVLAMSVLVYWLGRNRLTDRRHLWWGILVCLTPLLLKKSLFDAVTMQAVFQKEPGTDKPAWESMLNLIGLSYFTFNGISYLVDVRRGYIEPQRNYFRLLLYLLYFPTVFSGPLHRAKYFFQQLENITVSAESYRHGLRLILWGFFKNFIVAYKLHFLVTVLLASGANGWYSLLTGFLFFLYLYCSFSSFVSIFQGVSRIFNITLKDNFRNRVYLSASRQEFWQGWHITLNEWFRDYFFFPLAVYDKKKQHTYGILFLTFLMIAMWHGFTTEFLVWGTLSASWIVLEKRFDNTAFGKRMVRKKVLGTAYHLLISSVLSLIFISPDIWDTLDLMFTATDLVIPKKYNDYFVKESLYLLVVFPLMDHYEKSAGKLRFDQFLQGKSIRYRVITYVVLLGFILILGTEGIVNNYYNLF